MNFSPSLVRKLIYIVLIGALLIPISLVSRPATRNPEDNSVADPGGRLFQLREEHRLAQAQLSEIDPASETMKLASLGLRGVAVNILWLQANEARKYERWDQLAATLDTLILIQPNFIRVWEYQAHNLSYNVSAEFDDYEFRYRWVKRGIEFLSDGIAFNYRDHRITDQLGWFTGHKIAQSDERREFRRMFRTDHDFHDRMGRFIDRDALDFPPYGPDNWLLGYQWYDRSRRLVEEQNAPKYHGDVLFYMRRPSQLRNMALSLHNEHRTGEAIQSLWQQAHDEWVDYGRRQLRDTAGIIVTLDGMMQVEEEIEQLRRQLDELAPGIREEFAAQVQEALELSEEERLALQTPLEDRTDRQLVIARRVADAMLRADFALERRIAAAADEADRLQAERIADEIYRRIAQQRTIDRHEGTSNYVYWRARTAAESTPELRQARQLLYDAQDARRRSIFDDVVRVDPETGQQEVVRQGAISLYHETFQRFSELLRQPEFERLQAGPLTDDLIDIAQEYYAMLELVGMEWPLDFPLQDIIDRRAELGLIDDLPTSDDLAERLADERERQELQQQEQQQEQRQELQSPPDDPDAAPTSPGEPPSTPTPSEPGQN